MRVAWMAVGPSQNPATPNANSHPTLKTTYRNPVIANKHSVDQIQGRAVFVPRA
jgi:hypothetical protein